MANEQSWTDASKVIQNVWQLADCSSSFAGYSTFDGTSWNNFLTWEQASGRVVFQEQPYIHSSLNAPHLALFNDVNARAACANRNRFLLAPDVGRAWMWMDHTLAEGPHRSEYTLLSTNKQIWAIGGQLSGTRNNTVKTSVLNVEHHDPHLQWVWVDGPDLSYAVNQTSAAAWGDNGGVLFGGQSEQNPAPLMRLQNNTWSALEAKGTPPSPRLYPCIATSATTMYIYGGRIVNPTAQPDPLLYELNLGSLTWTSHDLLTTTGKPHPPSISDISCHLPSPGPPADPYLHVFSQISTPTFKGPAMQVLDLNTKTWQALNERILVKTELTSVVQSSPDNANSSHGNSSIVYIITPIVFLIVILIGFATCIIRTRRRANKTPANITTPGSSLVPPPLHLSVGQAPSSPTHDPIGAYDDIEMHHLA